LEKTQRHLKKSNEKNQKLKDTIKEQRRAYDAITIGPEALARSRRLVVQEAANNISAIAYLEKTNGKNELYTSAQNNYTDKSFVTGDGGGFLLNYVKIFSALRIIHWVMMEQN